MKYTKTTVDVHMDKIIVFYWSTYETGRMMTNCLSLLCKKINSVEEEYFISNIYRYTITYVFFNLCAFNEQICFRFV